MTYTTSQTSSWPAPSSLQEAEAALDSGRLYVAMQSGKWWQCRRNGMTRTLKTRPDVRIPIKAGFRSTGQFTELNLDNPYYFRVRPVEA